MFTTRGFHWRLRNSLPPLRVSYVEVERVAAVKPQFVQSMKDVSINAGHNAQNDKEQTRNT